MQVEAAVRVGRLHRLGRERPERGVQHAVVGGEGDDELVRVVAEREQRLDPDLQVVEVVVGHVEPHGEAAGDEVGDRPEVLLRRDDEPDLVGRHVPASRSSSSEVALAPGRGFLPRLHGVAPVAARLEVGGAEADSGGEARDLLHGARDRQAHSAHRRVDAVRGVDGAVGDLVDLVELHVHAVHAASNLVHHREDGFLRSPDERGNLRGGSGQPHEEEREREADGQQEHGERQLPEVPPAECRDQHPGPILVRRRDQAIADDGVAVVEHRRLARARRRRPARRARAGSRAPSARPRRNRGRAVAELRLDPLGLGVEPAARARPRVRASDARGPTTTAFVDGRVPRT